MNIGMHIAERILGQHNSSDKLAAEAFHRAKREEAKLGAKVFGTNPVGVTREFFCLDESTWCMYETRKTGKTTHTKRLRYEIRPYGIFVSVNDGEVQPVTKSEGENFLAAIDRYNEVVDEALQPILSRFS